MSLPSLGWANACARHHSCVLQSLMQAWKLSHGLIEVFLLGLLRAHLAGQLSEKKENPGSFCD